jgi:hypothetical protein
MKAAIKIDKKRHNIKPFKDLTTGEFLRFMDLGSDFAGYISAVTGLDKNTILQSKNTKILELAEVIGKIELPFVHENGNFKTTYTDNKIYDYTNERVYVLNKNGFNVGQRILIRNILAQAKSNSELMVEIVAVMTLDKLEFSEIETRKKELLECNYFEVLGLGAFFLHKLKNTLAREQKPSLISKIRFLINTKFKKKKQALRS